MLTLPVSVGEAVDKLSILDIKYKRLQEDSKKVECQKEYNELLPLVKKYTEQFPFQYKVLKMINTDIWGMQDSFRKTPDYHVCQEIIKKNDMRFRVKDSINQLTNSELKEQKGYTKTKALLLIHLDP